MIKIYFLLLFLSFSGRCFSQHQSQEFTINLVDNKYVIRSGINGMQDTLQYVDYPEFSDWSFLDSLRGELEKIYSSFPKSDTLNSNIESVRILVDSMGQIVYSIIKFPQKYGNLYSIEYIKDLNQLLMNFRFKFPDYKGSVLRLSTKTAYQKRVGTFDVLDIIYARRPNGRIITGWDGKYEYQLNNMVLGTWQDNRGEKMVFYKSSTRVYVKMLNPLTGIMGDFRCVFYAGKLEIYFDQDQPSIMSYKFQGDHLTLEGIVGNQKVIWNLKKTPSIP